MATSIVTSIADLSSLRSEWNALAEKAACPLLDHDWFLSCAEALHDERDLRIVTTREHGALTGVAPLVCESGGPGQHLVLLGAALLYEPSGWLYSSRAALSALTSAVLQLGAPVMLQRIPAASDMPGALAAHTRGRGLTIVRTISPSHGIDTRGSWDEFCSRMSRRTLGSLSKSLANAERVLWSQSRRGTGAAAIRRGFAAGEVCGPGVLGLEGASRIVACTSHRPRELLPELLPKSGGAGPIAHYSTDLWVTGCRCRSLDRCLRPKVGPEDWVPR